MTPLPPDELPTLLHAGFLPDLAETPRFVVPGHEGGRPTVGGYSCAYCGVGDGGELVTERVGDGGPAALAVARTTIARTRPTQGCVKLRHSLMRQRTVFPIHVAPSERRLDGGRRSLSHDEGIARLADLLLAHRPPNARTLVYACGQVDYFTIFSFQEVFRLLGVRNLAGNAEHCLNAGAVHNELLTGQEGPFLTIDQGLEGDDRLHILNGWNGLISHPPAFHRLMRRESLDAYLIEVALTESAKALAQKLGPERVLLIKSASDPHLALAIGHELLQRHPDAVDERFVDRFADAESFERYAELATEERFDPERVAGRIAAAPDQAPRILAAIRDIAAKLARPCVIPINIPSVGLSQTKGAVSHCLWGNAMALVGKYGLRPDGTPAGGTLRIPGQINAQTEVQGLSRGFFMGRIRVDEDGAVEAARRMGLPDDAYAIALRDAARCALDYSEPTGVPELFLCFGTQFESNMLGRRRWIGKLTAPGTTLVAVDSIPDPFSLRHAALVLTPPPHPAACKLYQNGEWRLSLSVPQKAAPAQARSDPTIVYDAMAEISRRLREDAAVREAHPDLARLRDYLRERFEPPERGGGLPRVDGEVSRPVLWRRVLDYMEGDDRTKGPLYCRPEHESGAPILWEELLDKGSIVYGGVGTTRYVLDHGRPGHAPFGDVYRRPGRYRFFRPTERDLEVPAGLIMTSGRSSLSDDARRVRFAVSTFNSGKATPAVDMPEENPLHVSLALADRLGLRAGDRVRVINVETGGLIVLPVLPTDRLVGDTVYVSFHKCRAELEQGRYLNDVTSHTGRCPYTAQSSFKATHVRIERIVP